LKSLNDTLLANQKQFQQQLTAAQQQLQEKEAELKDMQEQVCGLWVLSTICKVGGARIAMPVNDMHL
jgi:hypothetical protein